MQPLVSVPSSPQLSSLTAAEAAGGLSEDSAAADSCSGIETSSLLLHTAGDLRKKEPGRNISSIFGGQCHSVDFYFISQIGY